MPNKKISVKHIQIDKANQAVIIACAVASAVLVLGAFTSYALLKLNAHQGRVITENEKTLAQLVENIAIKEDIVQSYNLFTTTERNVLGGSTSGLAEGDKDGDNARLVLDALPSKYDFPALATSIETLLIRNNFSLTSFDGADDEINQQSQLLGIPIADAAETIETPEPSEGAIPGVIEIPFEVTVEKLTYQSSEILLGLLYQSIRPFNINRIQLSGSDSELDVLVSAHTYYQPSKTINISEKVIE